MAYCRMSKDSDVYLFAGTEWTCMSCKLQLAAYKDSFLGSREAALEHLFIHRAAGHLVPDHAIERLEREIAEGNKATGQQEEERPEEG